MQIITDRNLKCIYLNCIQLNHINILNTQKRTIIRVRKNIKVKVRHLFYYFLLFFISDGLRIVILRLMKTFFFNFSLCKIKSFFLS